MDYLKVIKDFKYSNGSKRFKTTLELKERYFREDKGIAQTLLDVREIYLVDMDFNAIEKGVFMVLEKVI